MHITFGTPARGTRFLMQPIGTVTRAPRTAVHEVSRLRFHAVRLFADLLCQFSRPAAGSVLKLIGAASDLTAQLLRLVFVMAVSMHLSDLNLCRGRH